MTTAVNGAVDAFALIAGMADTPKKSGKKDKPEVKDESLNPLIEKFKTAKRAEEDAKAVKDSVKDQITAIVGPKRLELCVEAGEVLSSVKVNGTLTFTQQSRYTPVPQEATDQLKEAFGDDFSRYFVPTLEIKLNDASANNAEVLKFLLDKLGPETFQKHFTVRRDLLVQPVFHNEYTTRADVQETASPFMMDNTIKPYAPSLKVS